MKSIAATTKSSHSTKTPKYIDDYFVLGKRKYIKLNSGPTTYFVVDSNKNICELVTIRENKDTGLLLFAENDYNGAFDNQKPIWEKIYNNRKNDLSFKIIECNSREYVTTCNHDQKACRQ